MDLKDLVVKQEGSRLDLRHPITGELLRYGKDNEKVMHLILSGVDSDIYRTVQRKVLDRRFKQQQKFRNAKITASMIEAEALEILSAVTTGGKIFADGKEVDISPDNAEAHYKRWTWMKEQADSYVEDRSNFL